MSRNKKPQVFYGWFILAGAAAMVGIAYSMRYSFSVFYAEILNEFGWTRAETAAAFSLNLLVYGVSAPVVGTLTDRFGPKRVLVFGVALLVAGLLSLSQLNNIWLFYLLFGIVIAIAITSLGFAVHYSYLPNWFVMRRGLAFGMLTAGAGIGNVLVTLYQHLISVLGWRATYVVLGAICLATILPLASFLIKRTPQEMGQLPDGAAGSSGSQGSSTASKEGADLLIVDREWVTIDWTLARALRTHRLWFMFLLTLFFSTGMNLVLAHQPIHCQDKDFSAMFAASVFGLAGVTTIIGNLCAFISDRIGREATYALGIFGSIIGVCALMLATTSQPWLLYLYVIFWGLFLGVAGPAGFSSLADIFSGKHYGAVNGFYMLGFGIGGAIGPWLGGYIFDVMNSYTLAFIIVIVALGLSSTCLWLAAPRKVRLVAGKAKK